MMNFAQIPILTTIRFHPDYTRVLDEARTQGYSVPLSDQRIKQNNAVVGWDNKGVWDIHDLIFTMATNGDRNFASLNLKNPTLFKATEVGSVTFTTNQGFTGNAIDSYLDTGWIPSVHGVNFTKDNASFGGKINSGSTSQSWTEWGCSTASTTSGSFFLGRFSGQIGYRVNDGFTRQVAEASPIGFWAVDRNGSGAGTKTVYKNGALFNTAGDNSVALPDCSFTIGCLNNGGTKQNFSGRQISFVYAGAHMTAQQYQDFYTIWNTYQTSL